MPLPKFEEKIATLVSSAVDRANPVLKGLILASYYAAADSGEMQSTGTILLDVAIIDGEGAVSEQLEAVPFIRTWGIQPSLPPIGATALMITNGNHKSGTYAIAVFDSKTSPARTLDIEAPDTLPKAML